MRDGRHPVFDLDLDLAPRPGRRTDARPRAFWPVAQFYVRLEGGGEDTAREDVAALPDHLDHVDGLIAAGTLDGEELNAADFQIGTTTRVLLNFPPLRHLVEGRPAAEHAMRIAPDFGREAPVEIPVAWIPAVPSQVG